jgi:hypothetical protein
MRRVWIALLGLIIVGGALYGGWRLLRPPLSDGDQIKAQILLGAKAAQDHRVGSLMDLIADDYNDGVYTRTDILNLARAGLRPGRDLQVGVFLQKLSISGKTAHTELDVDITVKPGGESGRYHIVADWQKGRRGWQVIRAKGWEGTTELG